MIRIPISLKTCNNFRLEIAKKNIWYCATRQLNTDALICYKLSTGVDKGGPGGPGPPNCRAEIFFVKIEGLLEPVVLNLSF